MNTESLQSSPCPITLSWKLPPNESFSDWTIIIENIDSSSSSNNNNNTDITPTTTTTYHVHKNILALGQRSSTYFLKLFQSCYSKNNKNFLSEAQTNTSEISLLPSAATAFPLLLDYIYHDDLQLTTDVAVAIRHLSIYFGVAGDDLSSRAMRFITSDVTFDNLLFYWNEATIYNDDTVINSILIPMVTRNFKTIPDDLLVTIPPDYLVTIVSSSELNCESDELSKRVAAYLQQSQGEINPGLFRSLTCAKRMPTIAPETALFFVNFDDKHCNNRSCRDDDDDFDDDDDDDNLLLSRCAKSFVNSDYSKALVAKRTTTTTNNKKKQPPALSKQHRAEYENLSSPCRIKLLESLLRHEKQQQLLRPTVLDLTNMLTRKLDDCVIAWGSGTPTIDGFFRPSGHIDGCTFYIKKGVWNTKNKNDDDGYFALYRDYDTWRISFWTEVPPLETEVRIYTCRATSVSSSLPMIEWECVAGEYPPPKLCPANDLCSLLKCFKP